MKKPYIRLLEDQFPFASPPRNLTSGQNNENEKAFLFHRPTAAPYCLGWKGWYIFCRQHMELFWAASFVWRDFTLLLERWAMQPYNSAQGLSICTKSRCGTHTTVSQEKLLIFPPIQVWEKRKHVSWIPTCGLMALRNFRWLVTLLELKNRHSADFASRT